MSRSRSLDEIAQLGEAEAYPDDPSAAAGVEWLQTHLSHVFLTGDRVYKLRKDVDLGFVNFTALEERNADCLREVALNRRMAPHVYLGLAPLRYGAGGAHFGTLAEGLADAELEHAVVMRRLPAGRDALSLLEAGCLTAAQLDRLARRVARFHAAHGLGVPAPFGPEEWYGRCTDPVRLNFELMEEAPEEIVARQTLGRARELARAFADARADRFEARRRQGRAVDGHGDLHLQHVWFERDDAEPIAIDCLEFDEKLRRIDAAAEVAFTAMDLAYRGRAESAERFLALYARERDDFDLYSVVDYFASYRAAVRAKVASLAARDSAIDAAQRERAAESAGRHLELAAGWLEPRRPGLLVLVGGVVGSGKSTAAGLLAERLPGVTIASDRVRKQRAGMAPDERPSDPDRLYAEPARERVYSALLERAASVVESGRNAILDATWSRRSWREEARVWAHRRGTTAVWVETRCDTSLARERLAARAADGHDPSDAGPELYARSVAEFEADVSEPEGESCRLDTGAEGWRRALEVFADKLRAGRA